MRRGAAVSGAPSMNAPHTRLLRWHRWCMTGGVGSRVGACGGARVWTSTMDGALVLSTIVLTRRGAWGTENPRKKHIVLMTDLTCYPQVLPSPHVTRFQLPVNGASYCRAAPRARAPHTVAAPPRSEQAARGRERRRRPSPPRQAWCLCAAAPPTVAAAPRSIGTR